MVDMRKTKAELASEVRRLRSQIRILKRSGEKPGLKEEVPRECIPSGDTDITGRKLAEEALVKSEDRYRDLVEHSNDLICTHDLQGNILSVNPAATRITGFSEDELLRMNLVDLLTPAVREQCAGYLAEIKAKGSACGQMEVQTKSGERRIWEYHNTLRSIGVSVPIVRGMAKDFTLAKLAEEQLRIYERTLDSSSNGILITDALQPDNPIIYCSKGFERLTGYSQREALGKNCRFLQNEDRDQPALMNIRRAIKEGKPVKEVIRNYRKDGSMFCNELSISPVFDANDRVTHFVGTQANVTERKKTMDELQMSATKLRTLAAHLQSIREEERTFVAREIHDRVGQALTALKIDLSFIEELLSGRVTRSTVSLILEKVQAMSGITGETIATVRTISTHLRPVLLDRLGLCAAIDWEVEQFNKRTGIKCDCLLPDEEVRITKDRATAVFRILQEALNNIARHSHAKNVKVELKQMPGNLILMIRDNGVGMSEESRISEDSFGILSMKERALVFGGLVDVEGVPGHGTVLTAKISLG